MTPTAAALHVPRTSQPPVDGSCAEVRLAYERVRVCRATVHLATEEARSLRVPAGPNVKCTYRECHPAALVLRSGVGRAWRELSSSGQIWAGKLGENVAQLVHGAFADETRPVVLDRGDDRERGADLIPASAGEADQRDAAGVSPSAGCSTRRLTS
jgi:hypothetical protein